MELPFAVQADSTSSSTPSSGLPKSAAATNRPVQASLQDSVDNDSLVTAESEGSFHDEGEETDRFHVPVVDAWQSQKPRASTSGATTNRVSHVLSQWGLGGTKSRDGASTADRATPEHHDDDNDDEIIDFTYVNVQETDADEVDILLAGGDPGMAPLSGSLSEHLATPPNILALFLSGRAEDSQVTLKLVDLSEQANEAVQRAATAKEEFKLSEALDAHSTAAKLFYEAALLLKDCNSVSTANSFLILSQAEAKSALALKRVIKLRPNTLQTKDRLRATLRGALDKKAEADISDSIFLGTVDKPPSKTAANAPGATAAKTPGKTPEESGGPNNPVDDIMQLERELQNMDMGLELGNSIASLDSRGNARLKTSTIGGSFMVVPPGSNSYLSSSMVLPANPPRQIRTVGRARANRVQNMIDASSSVRPTKGMVTKPLTSPPPPPSVPGGLESSWWGTASQVLSSSVSENHSPSSGTAPTKQLMRLMDSLKTLTDENAALLREVEEAESARAEARAAKQEMRRFREVYAERFEKLKEALEKFRKGYPEAASGGGATAGITNPVATSDYMNRASTLEQLARQEQLIRKLTADLKKEKEENRKKDAAIRKYESFYREVKARSAQKAAQRRSGQRPPTPKGSSTAQR